jgi:hypothetical protein
MLQKKIFEWKIDNESIQLPFKELSGVWKIENINLDNTKFALSQKLKYLDFARYISNQSFYDFTFSARIYLKDDNNSVQSQPKKKMEKDDEDEESIAAGLIFRHRNNFKYYMVFIDATEDEIDLVKNDYGKKIIKKLKYSIETNKWYKLSVKCYLENITIYLDDKEIFSINDSTSTGGKVGFVTYKKTIAYFNDIKIDTEIVSSSKGDHFEEIE